MTEAVVKRRIMPSALQRLKDTYRGDDVLLPAIQRHVMKNSGAPRPDDHSMLHMHPSDMAKPDWCGRHDFYRITQVPAEKEARANPSFRMENVWAEGTAIHDKYQRWLWEMGVLWGAWECLDCGHRWADLSPLVCTFCFSPKLRYKEVTLKRNRYIIEGHADGAIWDLDGFTGLLEVKSIGIASLRFDAPRLWNRYENGESLDSIWWKINRPFASHLKQGMLYLWMSWPKYEQIVYVYESKFNQQVKEFVVSYNKQIIAPVLEVAKEVSQGVRSGITPDRPIWAEGPDGKTCKSCEYRRTCWHLGAPDAQDEDHSPVVRVQRTTAVKRRRALSQAQLRPA